MVLIDETGEKLGVLPIAEAFRIAEERGFDLVEVGPQSQPPVCRLLDYGAYQFRQEKLERKYRAKQKRVELKGVRLSLKIGQHDLDVRIKQSKKFLEEGNKVRIEMLLRGRELAHQDLAREIINNFLKQLEPIIVEQPLKKEGKKFSTIVYQKKQDAEIKNP